MNSKTLKFTGTAGGFFLTEVVAFVTYFIIIIGWPIGFNYFADWLMGNIEVDGKKLKYSAGYGETLKFLVVNILLLAVTFGIYIFWFAPKTYRYILEHSDYVGVAAVPDAPAPALAPAVEASVQPSQEAAQPEEPTQQPPVVQ